MAEHLPLEELMIHGLSEQYKSDKATALTSRYFAIKDRLYIELLQWIRSNEPLLSDHGPDHIDNVLVNAYRLLENEIDGQKVYIFSGLDLYVLCLTILFHDVGNFFQREFHNQNIQNILTDMFSQFFTGIHKRQKTHIITAGRAHSGKGEDGTKDTLRDVAETEHCDGDKVNLRDIAAIVRLADELAEGPQRTCSYMQKAGKIKEVNKIYHQYADFTHIMIDANNGRININYEIELGIKEGSAMSHEDKAALGSLLTFSYERIFKLDQERKYCGYYCKPLKQIKETQISFNFFNNGLSVDFKREPLVLTDLTVPGDTSKSVIEGRSDLEIDVVVKELSEALVDFTMSPIGTDASLAVVEKDRNKTGWLGRILGRRG